MSGPEFPEGIELYRWYAAGPRVTEFRVASDHQPPAWAYQNELEAAAYHVPQAVTIRPMRGPYGWDEDLRVAVAFGAPIPLFVRPALSDDDVRAIIRTGRLGDEQEPRRSPLNLFRAMLEGWLRAMLDDEGEEWKRGRP